MVLDSHTAALDVMDEMLPYGLGVDAVVRNLVCALLGDGTYCLLAKYEHGRESSVLILILIQC